MEGYYFLDDLIVRCPAKPVGLYIDYCSDPINAVFQDPNLEQAILLASPSLHYDLCRYSLLDSKRQVKCRNAVMRYLARLSHRCTPFGLFSGVTSVKQGRNSAITLLPQVVAGAYLQIPHILKIADHFMRDDVVKRLVRYYPNPMMYHLSNEYKFVELLPNGFDIKYRFSSVERSPLIDLLLSTSTEGASWDELISKLYILGYSYDEAEALVSELVDNQMLLSELSVNLTGEMYLDRLSNFLISNGIMSNSSEVLQYIVLQLDQISCKGKITRPLLKHVEDALSLLVGPIGDSSISPVCIDLSLIVSSASTISRRVLKELERTLSFLTRAIHSSENQNLEKFKEVFMEVYGDNEVALCRVLDPETGIGYPVFTNLLLNTTDFLSGFALPRRASKEIELDPIEEVILEKILSSVGNTTEIELAEADFPNLRGEDTNALPASIFVLFEVISDEATTPPVVRLISAGDNYSCNLLARFTARNEELSDICRLTLSSDLQGASPSSQIVAQITHLPKSRAGNVMQHPHLFEYEIPIGSLSTLPRDKVLNYEDLLVSVRNGDIVLRSLSLDKEILPSLANAYDSSTSSMPVYRFLCDLQSQSYHGALHLSLHGLRGVLRYIPRVRYRNTILSPSTWRVASSKFSLVNLDDDDNELVGRMHTIFSCLGIPPKVYIEDGDNRLYVDITSPSSIRASLSIITGDKDVFFTEVLYSEETAVVRDQYGNGYANECVAFFLKKASNE